MTIHKHLRAGAVLAVASCVVVSQPALAANRVDRFSTNEYTPCGWSDLNAVASASAFRTTIVNNSGGDFVSGLSREDDEVADVHFMDSAYISGGLDSNGTVGFDRPSPAAAISYYEGHGYCGTSGFQGQDAGGAEPPDSYNCDSSSDCTDAPPGAHTPGKCVSFPTGLNRATRCAYPYNHYAAVCSTDNQYSGQVRYSWNNNKLWLGESSSAGSWAGAGTNGSTNLAVFAISCAGHIPSWAFDFDGFAGVRLVLLTAPHFNGDTAVGGTTPTRGASFAQGYANGSDNTLVAYSWHNAIPLIGGGSGCTGGINPGTGFNGCGAHIALSTGSSIANLEDNMEMTWGEARNDSLDATSAAAQGAWWDCNWDCINEPPYLP